jgi:hypothetical protein
MAGGIYTVGGDIFNVIGSLPFKRYEILKVDVESARK